MPMGHCLADPDKSGQAVHSAGFAPVNGTFRATDIAGAHSHGH